MCLESEGGELPTDAASHLLDCKDCRQAHQRNVTLRQLLSLKRYEQPDPHFETRLLAKVEAGIRDVEMEPAGLLRRIWNFISGDQLPAIRVVMAVAVLGLISLNLWSVQNATPLPSVSIQAAMTPAPVPALAASTPATNRYFDPSRPVVFLSSNQQPPGINYGNGLPSRLVNFDY